MLKRKRQVRAKEKFFVSARKTKSGKIRTDNSKNGMKKFPKKFSEDISSDSDVEDDKVKFDEPDTSDEDITEQEKRLKLAKKYLSEIEKEEKSKAELEETVNSEVSKRLKHDVLEKAGQLQRKVADQYRSIEKDQVKILRGHKLPVTCVTLSQNEKFMFSGSKDCSLIKWSLETGQKLKTIHGGRKGEENHVGHAAHVLCLALTTDDKFLASGDAAKVINVWNPDTMTHLHVFPGHRDAITGLSFRKGTHQLFSVSADRSVKIWNVDEMAYVETLFGHQDRITSVDSLTRDRAVTSGGRDSTVRLWKVPEESQLIFQGRSESIDYVRLINEQHFVSIADDGSISLWGLLKKKPLAVVQNAHGEGFWLSAVASLTNTDLLATGSHNGVIKLWKCGDDFKSLSLLFDIEVKGFVNALEFTKSGSKLIAAIGREHRFGRWFCNKEAKNCILVATLTD